jgi:hypothetical protein
MAHQYEPCKRKVLLETAVATKEEPDLVHSITDYYFRFTSETIKRGAFEAVKVPYFGKFQAKHRYVQHKNWVQSLPQTTEKKPE